MSTFTSSKSTKRTGLAQRNSSATISKIRGAVLGLFATKRILLPLLLFILLGSDTARNTVLVVLSEAYFQVGIFVYVSLALYYIATNKISPTAISSFIRQHPVYEVCISALLGMLPGCGGAIVVVTQYTKGVTSFGAVVAVLTSTMGDAAFLLLAKAPTDAILIMLISVVTGAVSGLLVNTFHNYRTTAKKNTQSAVQKIDDHASKLHHQVLSVSRSFWMWLSLPSLAIAFSFAFQFPIHTYMMVSEETITFIGAALCLFSILMWSLYEPKSGYTSIAKEDLSPAPTQWQEKSVLDTQFVLSWVVIAFLIFELTIVFFDFNLGQGISEIGPWVIALAVGIGLLPGCGPQILFASLYLTGAVPFSALLGNAISNDGDALFPAIALSPKAAILATVYSAIPAFLVGYGYWLLFE